ncbi:MAG: DUF1638 domain-containing protein [Nitrososphaerales archaeon]
MLKREIEKLMERGLLQVEPSFLNADLHVDYNELERELKLSLEKYSRDKSKVVVVYGDLCHPNMKGIIGKFGNVVKVDALNCIDCLLGGHGRLLEIDPNHDYFYLSPGWMPSNLKMSPRLNSIFDLSKKEAKKQFRNLKGMILIDSLGNLNEFKDEVKKFSNHTGLSVLGEETVGLDGLKDVIFEAIKKLREVNK